MKNSIVTSLFVVVMLFVGAMLFSAMSQRVSGQAATATPAEEATAMPAEEASTDNAQPVMSFAETVRQNTAEFKDVQAAEEAGYAAHNGCVSGPQGGAMGLHYPNRELIGDGELDALHPETLVYEMRDGELQLVAAEYIVLAEAWDANNDAPPLLMGQLFNFVSSPNRFGMPALYELHVWAWKHNPDGMFADWNPNVSCEEYTGDITMADMGQ